MTRRIRWALAAASLTAALLVACSDGPGIPVLTWYTNPDNGGQARLAARCTEAGGGRYRIATSVLPNDATAQREQLVRRLAAKDPSIDLMSLDPPFVAEFAEAGFLRPFVGAEAEALTEGVLEGPRAGAVWDGELVSAPFWANTQILWFRKSVAAAAGLDPAAGPVTWTELIQAAEETGTSFEVQARRYEGYMVWINALVASAGGSVLEDPEAGKDARPAIDSPAGRAAAGVIAGLAGSSAANPALSTADEEAARAAFQGPTGGFMVNWPYVRGAALEALESGSLDRETFEDIAWARYPRVGDDESHPPLGGINLGVGAFTRHPEMATEAVACITSPESQSKYMLDSGNPAARAAVYDDPQVRELFPMADLIRDSIDDAAPRPATPYYTDVSSAVVRAFHPPASVRPASTPEEADELIVDVLHDRVLL